MKRIDPRIYVAILLAALLVPGLPSNLLGRLQNDNLLNSVNKRDYLASLHNATAVGCLNLRRYEPETVFIGDSHAYAAIDYLEVGDLLGDDSVGQCALPGAFLPSFSLFLDWLAQSSYRPDRLVLIVSPRQFAKLGDTTKRLEQHRKLLFDSDSINRTLAKWRENAAAGKPLFGRDEESEIRKRDLQETTLEKVDEKQVTRYIEQASPPHLIKWQEEVPKWQAGDRVAQEIQSFCGKIRKLGIPLHIVHAPESPLGEAIYLPRQWSRYRQTLGNFDCASSVHIITSSDVEIGNRHFINRMAQPDFDYGIFARSPAEVNAVSEKDWYQIFDMDHPNRAAARKITREIVSRLRGR